MSAKALKHVLQAFAAIALITGGIDLTLGLAGQQAIGMVLSVEDLREPILNSQIRYLGAIWFGFGILLLVCASNIHKHAALLRTALAIVFLGGLGRLATVLQFGLPDAAVGIGFVYVAIGVELIGVPLLLWWHHQLTAVNRYTRRKLRAKEWPQSLTP